MRHTLALGVAVLVAMTLGRVLSDHVPLGEVSTKPFVRTAAVGQSVSLRYADLRVTGVRSAAFLSIGTAAYAPGGRFLIADATYVAKGEPRTIDFAVLHGGDGRSYAPSSRGGCTGQAVRVPAGVPYHVMYCFDLPRGAIAGSALEVSLADPGFGGGQARDDLARVHLGIDDDSAARLWRTRSGYSGFGGGFDRPSTKTLTLTDDS